MQTMMSEIFSGYDKFDDVNAPVFITGVARSGTTILSKLIGTLENIEVEYEPWLLAQLPALLNGNMRRQEAVEIFKSFCFEVFSDRLLGRGVNLRPSDASFYLNFKSQESLDQKWMLTDRREAWRYARDNGCRLAMKNVDLHHFYVFMLEAVPNIKIIHLLRHPVDVARSIELKKWFTDEALLHTPTMSLKKRCQTSQWGTVVMPWWIEDADVEFFKSANDFERGLMCWRIMLEKEESQKRELGQRLHSQYLEVRYEDLIANGEEVLCRIADFLNTRLTGHSNQILGTVDGSKYAGQKDIPFQTLPLREQSRILELAKMKQYQIPKSWQHAAC